MRILALTEDASISVTLSQPPFGHDVVAIRSIEELEEHGLPFDVALLDLGTTRRGLVGASDVIRSGVSAPCLVVGDENPIELAVELAPDASVIVRPFSIEELDARLEELTTLTRDLRRINLAEEVQAKRAAAEEPAAAGLAAEPGPPAEPAAEARSDDALPPRVEFRMREHAAPHDPEEEERIARTRSLLTEASQLERFLAQVPEVVDRRAVADRLLAAVERDLRPLVSVLWVPAGESGYEALTARRLNTDERVPFDQSLFLSFETNLDAVLVAQVDPSQHPTVGIPGLRGETLVAAALRVDDALQGVVMAAGTGYTEVDRDQLHLVAIESAPALAVAGVFERLRARQIAIPPPGRQQETS